MQLEKYTPLKLVTKNNKQTIKTESGVLWETILDSNTAHGKDSPWSIYGLFFETVGLQWTLQGSNGYQSGLQWDTSTREIMEKKVSIKSHLKESQIVTTVFADVFGFGAEPVFDWTVLYRYCSAAVVWRVVRSDYGSFRIGKTAYERWTMAHLRFEPGSFVEWN